MSTFQIPLLLLKNPTSSSDAYTTHFACSPWGTELAHSPYNYEPIYVPVLEHTHHLDALLHILRSASSVAFPYSGLIFTSARAVEAFAVALAALVKNSDRAAADLKEWRLPLYIIGPPTADALRKNILPTLCGCEVLGEEAGTGEALAPLIIKDQDSRIAGDLNNKDGKVQRPLLFLAGEKHRDIIPRRLLADGFQVEEMVVYSTAEGATFRRELEQRLQETEERTQASRLRWIVLFSAAAGEAILKALGWLDDATGGMKAGWEEKDRKTFVASIGPTTKEYMWKHFGFEVDVCAEKPSAEGVREGIEKFMTAEGRQRFGNLRIA